MSKDRAKHHIIMIRAEKINEFSCREDESILEAFQSRGIYMSAVCGGKGTCGKCRIRLIKGTLDITEQDRKVFSENELQEGFRLSCRAFPKEDCTIRADEEEESGFEVISDYRGKAVPDKIEDKDKSEEAYAIGVDIGTTTIAMDLIGLDTGKIKAAYTAVNRQRAYGADVISRIQASAEGKNEELRTSIRKDLLTGFETLIKDSSVNAGQVIRIAIAGNTTMGHLLMGYSCVTLGAFPYKPVNNGWIRAGFFEIFKSDLLDVPVVLLPGISAFVGADIAAGLLAAGFDTAGKTCMLIDLGTNGEMAIGDGRRILVSSTAAGPAFEGGNISSGMGSISGAISHVTISKKKASVRTIGDKPPAGICGTGVIETVSEFLKEGLIDQTGLYREEYFEKGFELAKDLNGLPIVFTQKDIREVQLAKAAVRAGIEILLRRFGTDYDGIDAVYLAGGFGFRTDTEKAVRIGLLPEQFKGRIKAIGNSSLAGASIYLTDTQAKDRLDKILSVSQEISLSEDEDFYGLYVEHMNFNA